MKPTFKIVIFNFFLLISMTSCQSKDESLIVLEKYLNEDLNIEDIEIPHLYFFLPADSCSGVVSGLIPYFNSLENEDNYTIILIGRSKRRLDFLAEGFENREQIQYDIDGRAFKRNIVNPSTPRIYKVLPDDKIEVVEYPGLNITSIQENINSFLHG